MDIQTLWKNNENGAKIHCTTFQVKFNRAIIPEFKNKVYTLVFPSLKPYPVVQPIDWIYPEDANSNLPSWEAPENCRFIKYLLEEIGEGNYFYLEVRPLRKAIKPWIYWHQYARPNTFQGIIKSHQPGEYSISLGYGWILVHSSMAAYFKENWEKKTGKCIEDSWVKLIIHKKV
jgi:hypothetical protein